MSKLHLAFKSFEPTALVATDALFTLRPWKSEDPEAQRIAAQVWLDEMCRIYDLPAVQLRWDLLSTDRANYMPQYGEGPDIIYMSKLSMIMLFSCFAEHRGQHSNAKAGRKPFDWACSLFYAVRPKMFRARVREGRIGGVEPRDLYTAQTWGRIVSANLDPTQRNVLSILARIDAGEVTEYGSRMVLRPNEELDALAALQDEEEENEPLMMTASSVEPEPDVIEQIEEEAEERIETASHGLANISLVELRKLSRGKFSGGYSMKKPELIANLIRVGVTNPEESE